MCSVMFPTSGSTYDLSRQSGSIILLIKSDFRHITMSIGRSHISNITILFIRPAFYCRIQPIRSALYNKQCIFFSKISSVTSFKNASYHSISKPILSIYISFSIQYHLLLLFSNGIKISFICFSIRIKRIS